MPTLMTALVSIVSLACLIFSVISDDLLVLLMLCRTSRLLISFGISTSVAILVAFVLLLDMFANFFILF